MVELICWRSLGSRLASLPEPPKLDHVLDHSADEGVQVCEPSSGPCQPGRTVMRPWMTSWHAGFRARVHDNLPHGVIFFNTHLAATASYAVHSGGSRFAHWQGLRSLLPVSVARAELVAGSQSDYRGSSKKVSARCAATEMRPLHWRTIENPCGLGGGQR